MAQHKRGHHHHRTPTSLAALGKNLVLFASILAVMIGAVVYTALHTAPTPSQPPADLAEIKTAAAVGDPATPNSNTPGDVTINDTITTNTAAVTAIKQLDKTTGTAPFDDNDDPGNDSSQKNAIVRSFDTLSYDVQYVLTPDDPTTYYRHARVKFTAQLPLNDQQATFDLDSMGWVDRTKGFEPKITSEQKNDTTVQTLTAYRVLDATPQVPTVVPGTSSITLPIKVQAAPNGTKIAPTVSAQLIPDDNQTREPVSTTLDEITVSAAPRYNIRLAGWAEKSPDQNWNIPANEDSPNPQAITGRGVIQHILLAFDARNKDRTQGLKGIEMPHGDITFKFKATNSLVDAANNQNPVPLTKENAPQLIDIRKPLQTPPRTKELSDQGYMINDVTNVSFAGYSSTGELPGNGTTTLVNEQRNDDGSTEWTLKISDYTINVNEFLRGPRCKTPPWTATSEFTDLECTRPEVAEITVAGLVMFTPTTKNGQPLAESYHTDLTHQVTYTDRALNATSLTGQKLPTVSDTSNQTVTNDDHTTHSQLLRPPGKWAMDAFWKCADNNHYWYTGNDCVGWYGADMQSGTDVNTVGSDQHVSVFQPMRPQGPEDLPFVTFSLAKIDPKIFDIPPAENAIDLLPANQRYVGHTCEGTANCGFSSTPSSPDLEVFFAVKKGGWANEDEQRNADLPDLEYYANRKEAESHGTIVGYLWAGHTGYPTKGYSAQHYLRFPAMPLKIKTDAPAKTVTELNAIARMYTRQDAVTEGLLPADYNNLTVTSPNDQWDQASRATVFNNTTIPDLLTHKPSRDNYNLTKQYRKASYSDEGAFLNGGTSGSNYGDSLYIVSEKPTISKTTAQKQGDKPKTVYDLDNNQRIADYKINVAVGAQLGKELDCNTVQCPTTDVYVTDTLPKGETYIDGSAYIGGTYNQPADYFTGGQGSITGGTRVDPEITPNEDGTTTTLKWSVPGVKINGDTIPVYYSTKIGQEGDPDNDVQNNQQLVNTASVTSKNNKGKPTSDNGQIADFTIKVSRLRSQALSLRANPLYADLSQPVNFVSTLGNFSQDQVANPYAINVLPSTSNASAPSSYHGDYTLSTIVLTGRNGADLSGVKVKATNDFDYSRDVKKITRAEAEKWTTLPLDPTTGVVTVPQNMAHAKAWVLLADSLPPNARFDATIRINPTGNQPADSYTDVWSDGDNRVIATSAVVDRVINGVTWYDLNGDGIRQDNDKVIPGAKVSVYTKDGQPVRGVGTNQVLTTTTDSNGHYEITRVPAGEGFTLRFERPDGVQWDGYTATVKDAEKASEDTDSDADQVTKAGDRLDYLTAAVPTMPAVADIRTSRYTAANIDAGLTGDGWPITPVAPTLVKATECGAWDTITIPQNVEGVTYRREDVGHHVTIIATFAEGYTLADGATARWEFDLERKICPVTPVAPTLTKATECGKAPQVTLPQITGVLYSIHQNGDKVTIVARAADGYTLTPGAINAWSFSVAAEPCDTTITWGCPQIVDTVVSTYGGACSPHDED